MGKPFDPCDASAPWAQAWTLAAPTAPLKGLALHSGAPARVQMWPGDAGSGLCFAAYSGGQVRHIPARLPYVADTHMATTLAFDGHRVSTVEHVLAALWGLGLGDVVVEIEGPELPAVDGSALPWVELLREAQAVALPHKRPLAALPGIRVGEGDAWVEGREALANGPRVGLSLEVAFAHSAVGAQSLNLDLEALPQAFVRELAGARTFGAQDDWARLKAAGKALGANACNCVPLAAEGPLVAWRWPNEVARHKALDALGDLALSGLWWEGHLALHHAGHGLHVAFAREWVAFATQAS